MVKCDIMVFAPHPDDEALGCANVISRAIENKKTVKVVVVANGESSIDGTQRYYGHTPGQEDFINIGYVRQKESISAMKVLGLKEEDVIFLGYPNDGLFKMISSDEYSPINPYKSEFTGFDRVSYKNSFNMGAPFCKESIFDDVRKIITSCNPDEVYMTHPMDSHQDHKACGRFVYDLSKEIKPSIKVRCYLISPSKIPSKKHRMVYMFTGQLEERYLDESERNLKKKCIHQYKSQSYLFDEIAFHYDVERFFQLEHGFLIKLAKKLKPNLIY